MSFHQFTRDEFEAFLEQNVTYEEVESQEYWERVYDIPLPNDDFCIRIFSTIDKDTDKAREKGSDSIKCVVWSYRVDEPVGGREYTQRINTYQKNLLKKIQYLMANWKKFTTECPECGNIMVLREGEYGEFLGCSSYPECKHTEQVEDVCMQYA